MQRNALQQRTAGCASPNRHAGMSTHLPSQHPASTHARTHSCDAPTRTHMHMHARQYCQSENLSRLHIDTITCCARGYSKCEETSPTDVYTFTHMHTHAQPRAHTLMYMCGAMHTHLGVHRYVHALIDTHDVCIHAHARSHSHLHLLICMHMDAHACARTHAQSRTCTQMPQTCTHARTCTNMLAHIHLQV